MRGWKEPPVKGGLIRLREPRMLGRSLVLQPGARRSVERTALGLRAALRTSPLVVTAVLHAFAIQSILAARRHQTHSRV